MKELLRDFHVLGIVLDSEEAIGQERLIYSEHVLEGMLPRSLVRVRRIDRSFLKGEKWKYNSRR